MPKRFKQKFTAKNTQELWWQIREWKKNSEGPSIIIIHEPTVFEINLDRETREIYYSIEITYEWDYF